VTSAGDLKDIWTSIFRRSGGNGAYSGLFDDLPVSLRNLLLAEARLRETELPVIGSVADASNWFVLTTERLIWSRAGPRHEIAAGAVREVASDLEALRRSGLGKSNMRSLRVTTVTGEEHEIVLEPGKPLIGAWNVLRNLYLRNRRAVG
jgi:hypothetical protein